MASNSTLDPDNIPPKRNRKTLRGHSTRSLGPSDSSDSGSDVAGHGADRYLGDLGLDSDSDRVGTGEHLSAGTEPDVRLNADQQVDRVVDEKEAGLGRGLDQAEEARRGRTRYGTKPRKRRGRAISIRRG
jgi:hypothetical protein